MRHYTEDELTLYHYGEPSWRNRRDRIEQHLQTCEACAATYRDIARTLGLVGNPDVPERDERYGLEMWQRVRHNLPAQDVPWFTRVFGSRQQFALAAAAVLLMVTAFVAGRTWPRSAA